MSSPSHIDSKTNEEEHKTAEIQVVPVVANKYSISKKITTQNFIVEKRWMTGTAKIEVPMKYEEVYVNGKKLGSKDGLESILSSMKGMIGGGSKKEESEKKMIRKKKEALKGELAPLFGGSSNTQEVLPLFGEEILIRKRIRQVGEAVITKRKITENKKIPLSTKSERIIIRYPDGTETDITSRNTTTSSSSSPR
jgi:stress response protein YsnF